MTPNLPQTQHRLSWIDYDKGISIILVCYLHLAYLLQRYFHVDPDAYWLLKYSNIFLYGFRMPLFFMISGILLQSNLLKKGLAGYIKNRFNTIFYPLLVWGVIRVALQIAVGSMAPKHGSAIMFLYIVTDPRQIAPLWYLHALFCISVIYAFIKIRFKLSSLHNFAFGLLLYLVSDYVTTTGAEVGFFSDIFKYYVFFSIGDLLSGLILSEQAKKYFYSGRLFFILLVPFVLVQAIVMKFNIAHRDTYYVENVIPMLYFLQGLVGCGFSIALSFLLQKWNIFNTLKTIGSHSLYIYCMHYLVIIISCMLFVKILHIHNTLFLVAACWSIAVGVPIIFFRLSMKYNFWWVFSLTRPKPVKPLRLVYKKSSPVVPESSSPVTEAVINS